jgi:hypothetical protein
MSKHQVTFAGSLLTEALSSNETRDQLQTELDELLTAGIDNCYVWIRDFGTDWVFYELSGSGAKDPGLYKIGYTVGADDVVDLDGDPVEVIAKTTYEPVPADTDESIDIVGDCVLLVESAVRADGTVPIKLIEDGWSANGRYYPKDVLERDGANAFPAGTHMFWDHPTATEAEDRPERSLRDLSAVLISDAKWMDDGPAGSGLYSDAKVMADYQPFVEELAPFIGVSIRAAGITNRGTAPDGQSGDLVERITVGKSVDFVTTPAAGGEIVSLFESVRATGPTPRKDRPMPPTTNLEEVQRELTEANRELAEATALGDLAAAERDRLREGQVITEARTAVTEQLAKLAPEQQLPDITKTRLVESASANPPMTTDGKLDTTALTTRVEEAVKVEREYLATLAGGGRITGFGPSTDDTDPTVIAESEKGVEDAMGRLGLSESAAKEAARGR